MYLENEDLNAGQPFNYTSSARNTIRLQRQLDFGASAGGPVWIPHVYNGRNKTFFYFAYEEYHNKQTLNQGTITVPTAAYRNGDLSSNLLGPIVDSGGNPVRGLSGPADDQWRSVQPGDDPSSNLHGWLHQNGPGSVPE